MMTKQKRILFIGNYLSGRKGTTALAVRLKDTLQTEYTIDLISSHENRILRFVHMLWHALFNPAETMVVDVFSGRAFQFATWCTQLSSLFRKRKIILMLRGGKFSEYYAQHAPQVRTLLGKADTVATPSLFLQHEFGKEGIALQYLPNFLNLEQFPFTQAARKPFQLLWVRAFSEIYQPQVAIDVLAALVPSFPEIGLTMVGPDDGLLQKCKQYAQQYGVLHRIHFTGPLAYNELPTYYQTHSVYLNTTRYESFGNALMEAASSGIPIVSNAVGEIPFIWKDGESIMLVNQNATNEFVKAITMLWHHPEKVKSLTERARRTSEQFSWQQIEPRWHQLLQ